MTTWSAGRCSEPNGNVTVNVEPSPGTDSTVAPPPWRSASLGHERQPDAGALVAARARADDAVEALEQALLVGGLDADAGVDDRQLGVPVAGLQPHRDPARERELERVREQVHDDLRPHLAVHVHRLRERRGLDRERQAGALEGRARTCSPARPCSGPGRSGAYAALMRPDCRRAKSSSVLTSLSRRCALRWMRSTRTRWSPSSRVLRGRERVLGRAEQQGQRRAQLVADVGEERGLGLVELDQRAPRAAAPLVRAHVGETGGDLARRRGRGSRGSPRRARGSG